MVPNDTVDKTSGTIVDDILKLNHYMELQLPDKQIIISCPIIEIEA